MFVLTWGEKRQAGPGLYGEAPHPGRKTRRHAWLEYQQHHSSPAVVSSHIHHGLDACANYAHLLQGAVASMPHHNVCILFCFNNGIKTEEALLTRHKVLSKSLQ